MLDPVVILVGCLLAAGAWALPHPAPQSPTALAPAPPNTHPDLKRLAESASFVIFGIGSGYLLGEEMRKRKTEFHDLDRMFAPNQLSSIGREGQSIDTIFQFDPALQAEAVDNAALSARFYAYKLAVRSQINRILYVMTRDDIFLDCMLKETGRSPFSDSEHGLPNNAAFFFFTAEVCQLRGHRYFGILFPRIEKYYTHREEPKEFSEANVRLRARSPPSPPSPPPPPPSSNAFHASLPAPPPLLQQLQQLHGLSRMVVGLRKGAGRVERAVEKAAWAKWEAEPKALLLEGHY
ncbi:MAG: hypothetical protein M1826_003036 [Phylliscum demangeonii]|nr:MAG: hypothetical protein M1826_003036 [Phylliscum demangeonii]